MTLDEMFYACYRAACYGENGLTFVIPRRPYKGRKIRLTPHAGPLCEVLDDTSENELVVFAELKDIGSFLAKARVKRLVDEDQ